jgi:hypothetical protein
MALISAQSREFFCRRERRRERSPGALGWTGTIMREAELRTRIPGAEKFTIIYKNQVFM